MMMAMTACPEIVFCSVEVTMWPGAMSGAEFVLVCLQMVLGTL